MLMSSEKDNRKKQWFTQLKEKYQPLIIRFKALQGDPHYIAMGMGIGIFVAITPTIPFHTAIALAMAFLLKGSKPAAAIGVWFNNPITIPPFYYGSYKVGCLMIGKSTDLDMSNPSISSLMQMGLDVAIAAIGGGVILGIISGIVAYYITLRIFKAAKSHKKAHLNI